MNEIADELIVLKHKIDDGHIIGLCPICDGGLFISDYVEKICTCHKCGYETKYT